MIAPIIPPPPTLSESAASAIRGAVIQWGCRELSFACQFDADRNEVTRPRLVFVGMAAQTRTPAMQYGRGEVALHIHPSGSVAPSREDLDVAAALVPYGVALAISDPTGSRLFSVTTPPMCVPAPDRLDHLYLGRRVWKLGRFSFDYTPLLRSLTLRY